MFKPDTIEHVNLIVPKISKDKLLSELHEKGVCQIDTVEELRCPEDIRELMLLKRNLERVQSKLKEYLPLISVNGIKQLFSPPKPKQYNALIDKKDWLNDIKVAVESTTYSLNERLTVLDKLKQKQKENQELIETYGMLPEMPTKMLSGTENILCFVGLIQTNEMPNVKIENNIYYTESISSTETLLITYSEDKKVLKKLFELGFRLLEFEKNEYKPSEVSKKIKKDNSRIKRDITKIKRTLKKLAFDNDLQFRLYLEELTIFIDKENAKGNFSDGSAYTTIELWIPKRNMGEFERLTKRICGDYLAETLESNDAPSLLKNNGLFKPFEIITKLYSIPKYKHFDPTFFIGITFPLFFGIMLTDFIYGIALTLFALALINGIGKYDKGIKNFSMLLIVDKILKFLHY